MMQATALRSGCRRFSAADDHQSWTRSRRFRLGVGPVLVRVVQDQEVDREAGQALAERHRPDAAALGQ